MSKSDSRFNLLARVLFSAVVGVAFLCGAGGAARPRAAIDAATTEQLRLAARLADYGDRQRDPLAMIIAARIQAGVGVRPSPAKVLVEGISQSTAGRQSLMPAALLTRAEAYAAGRGDYLGLISEQRQERERGALRGPFIQRALAPAGAVQRLLVTFARGASAVFGIAGDADEEFEFEIFDANGKLICRGSGRGKATQCNWVPDTTAEVEIKVRNHGPTANEFTFFHN